jgi:hypothetical protein
LPQAEGGASPVVGNIVDSMKFPLQSLGNIRDLHPEKSLP